MTQPSEHPIRKRPARGIHAIPGQPTMVFVTVCTKNSLPWLSNQRNFETLRQLWRDEAAHWRVGLFTLMPEHLHLLASKSVEDSRFLDWMRFWKRRFHQIRGGGPQRFQESQWDTRIRNAEHFLDRAEYIRENAVRRGLAARADEWPYTGVVHELEWFQDQR